MKQGARLAARILGAYAVIYVAYLYVPVLFLPLTRSIIEYTNCT